MNLFDSPSPPRSGAHPSHHDAWMTSEQWQHSIQSQFTFPGLLNSGVQPEKPAPRLAPTPLFADIPIPMPPATVRSLSAPVLPTLSEVDRLSKELQDIIEEEIEMKRAFMQQCKEQLETVKKDYQTTLIHYRITMHHLRHLRTKASQQQQQEDATVKSNPQQDSVSQQVDQLSGLLSVNDEVMLPAIEPAPCTSPIVTAAARITNSMETLQVQTAPIAIVPMTMPVVAAPTRKKPGRRPRKTITKNKMETIVSEDEQTLILRHLPIQLPTKVYSDHKKKRITYELEFDWQYPNNAYLRLDSIEDTDIAATEGPVYFGSYSRAYLATVSFMIGALHNGNGVDKVYLELDGKQYTIAALKSLASRRAVRLFANPSHGSSEADQRFREYLHDQSLRNFPPAWMQKVPGLLRPKLATAAGATARRTTTTTATTSSASPQPHLAQDTGIRAGNIDHPLDGGLAIHSLSDEEQDGGGGEVEFSSEDDDDEGDDSSTDL